MAATDRNAARRELLDLRQRIDEAARADAERRITAGLIGSIRSHSTVPGILGVYWPMRGEPDVRAAYPVLHEAGWTLALPRVAEPRAPLTFGRWLPGTKLLAGRFGVHEPDPFEVVQPTLLVMPCVGFDPEGFRLGYGGGFYDRTLAQLRAPALGVAFEGTCVQGFVPDPHDWPMTALVTEAGTRQWPADRSIR